MRRAKIEMRVNGFKIKCRMTTMHRVKVWSDEIWRVGEKEEKEAISEFES